jgi:WD40 repeat protein/serine/threonine protein kinase
MAENTERDIFVHAHHLASDAEREAYLNEACADRPDLLERVKQLFEANAIEDGFLATPAANTTIAFRNGGLTEGSGTVIGRYKLLERIGEGGMAVVYMAEQEQPVRRKVAVKIIKPGMDTESVIARFEAERQALALMDHAHIAKIFDGGATDTGRPYFAMELVRGVPITEYCDQNQLVSRERLGLFIQACEAVQHAHQKGIIHRDLKPSNVLVTLQDGKPIPKVIDFGIAKATRDRLTDKTLFTRFQFFVGTPAYMSPEQAHMDSTDIDTRADIYALGTLLYELLTGLTPFDPKELTSLEDCRRTIVEKDPVRPSSRVATLLGEELTATAKRRRTEPGQLIRLLRSDLDWITMKCLEKDRTRRYETASALAQDIHRYLDGDTVVARPPTTRYRLQKFVHRNKVAVAIATLMLLAAVVSTWQAVRATRAVRVQDRLTEQLGAALKQEEQQRRRAEEGEEAASRRAYNSDMTLAQLALSANNYGRVVGLLDRYRPKDGATDFRRWEWRYFWDQVRSEAKFALPQQPDAIAGLAVSPDSRLLVTTDLSQTLKLWDLTKRTVLLDHEEPGLNARVFALSHNGAHLATVVRQGRRFTVRIWSVAERKVTFEFSRDGWVRTLAFTPDDEELVLFGHDQSVDKWRFRNQQLENILSARATSSAPTWGQGPAELSRDCKQVAFLAGDRIRVLDIETGGIIADLAGFQEGTWSLAFSPDGTILAAGPSSAATSTDIKLFSVESGTELRRLVGHVSWVPALAFTPTGSQLVSTGADQTVRIWNVHRGEQRAVLHGHLSEIYRVTVSSDGNTIVSGAKDGSILVWNGKHVERRNRFDTLPIPVSQIVFVPNSSELLAVDPDGRVTAWDFETLQPLGMEDSLGQEVKKLLVSSDGTRVYATTGKGNVTVLDWPTRQVITTLGEQFGRGSIELAGLINRDRTLVLVLAGSSVRLVDTTMWKTNADWQTDSGAAWLGSRASVSGEAGMLAVGTVRGPLHIFDLANGEARTIRTAQPWGASDIAFSPDGRLLATSSLDGTIRLWDTANLQMANVLHGHLIGVNAVVFSPAGQRLASGSQGEEAVKLWDVSTGQEVATLEGEGLISAGLAFSPDGNLLVGINAQHKVHIWRAPSLDEIEAEESRSAGDRARPTLP